MLGWLGLLTSAEVAMAFRAVTLVVTLLLLVSVPALAWADSGATAPQGATVRSLKRSQSGAPRSQVEQQRPTLFADNAQTQTPYDPVALPHPNPLRQTRENTRRP